MTKPTHVAGQILIDTGEVLHHVFNHSMNIGFQRAVEELDKHIEAQGIEGVMGAAIDSEPLTHWSLGIVLAVCNRWSRQYPTQAEAVEELLVTSSAAGGIQALDSEALKLYDAIDAVLRG